VSVVEWQSYFEVQPIELNGKFAMPIDPRQLQLAFLAALECTNPGDRAAVLDRECGDDLEFRRRVENLLTAHNSAMSDSAGDAAVETVKSVLQQHGSGTPFAGRYQLVEKLGEGGMGVVFVADQVEPVQRRVALKIIRARLPSKVLMARFEQERQALALMDHPNIAKIYDAGVAGDTPYFAMEFIKGLPITKFCDDARLTTQQRLELFIPVCQALQHAHQKGVIHRDLKPSNIIVGSYDGRPVPKIIDFGVAKMTGPRLNEHIVNTEIGSVIGTFEYMSPEQAELDNLDIDTRTDIYALGIILYELLSGTVPFSRKELELAGFGEMLRVIKERDPPKPSTKLSSSGSLPSIAACRHIEPAKLTRLIRGDLDWITLKCLEKDRARRYETANGLCMDIQRYLGDEPILAGPPRAGYRFGKFVKRNKGAVITSGLILLSLVAGVVGTSIGLRRAIAERNEKEAARAQIAIERDRTEEEKQISLAVTDFLRNKLLGLADPKNQADALVAAGRPSSEIVLDPRISVLLDRAAAESTPDKIEERFPKQPMLQANVLRTMGDAFLGVGKYPEAISHLDRARKLWVNKHGANYSDAMTTLNNLARAHQESGNLSEAIRLFEELNGQQMTILGPDHLETLTTMNNLAEAYKMIGKFPEAILLLERVRDARIAKLGSNHPHTLGTLHNLAGAYRLSRRLPEAIKLYEQVRDIELAKLGDQHPSTLQTLNNLALAYRDSGRLPEAIQIFENVRAVRTEKLGPDHPDTMTTIHNLALAYRDTQKLPEAIRLFEQVRDADLARFGPDHPNTLTTMASLAKCYQSVGRLPEALTHFDRALTGLEKLRFQHQYAGPMLNVAVSCYEQANDFEKAETWRRKWLAVVKQKSGKDLPAYAAALTDLARNQILQKKFSEAETLLRESLTIQEISQPEAWTAFNAKSMLGGALLGQKKYADAEPLLLAGYEGMKKHEANIPPTAKSHMIEAVECLVRLYEAMDKKDEAAKWNSELEKMKEVRK